MNLIAFQNAYINLEHVMIIRRSSENLHLTLCNGESFEIEGAAMKRMILFLKERVAVDLNQAEEYFANLTAESDLIMMVLGKLLELQYQGPVYVKTVADQVHRSSKSIGTILRKVLHIKMVRRGKGWFLILDDGQLEQLRHEFGLP